jgi:CobQ-like glutamine amidotransferase family enzyme
MGILFIFLTFIYRLKVKVQRIKMTLTLDERVEIVLLSGHQGWTQRQVADEFNARHPELQTAVLLSIPICWAEKMRRVSG